MFVDLNSSLRFYDIVYAVQIALCFCQAWFNCRSNLRVAVSEYYEGETLENEPCQKLCFREPGSQYLFINYR